MERTFCSVLLLLSLSQTFGKYVYIWDKKTWTEAQRHCRLFYTDLAAPSSQYDNDKLEEIALNYHKDRFQASPFTWHNQWTAAWIGLMRVSTNPTTWMWSGGGNVTKSFWRPSQRINHYCFKVGLTYNSSWFGTSVDYHIPFFCYHITVVREKKTWEEALDYCREHHGDLASVASDTEMMLIQRELRKSFSTQRVWIGLRFLQASWLWVDRQPLDYQAWGNKADMVCPAVNCAAIQLPMVNGTVSNGSKMQDGELSGVPQTTEPLGHWVPVYCRERLHFICY